MILPEGIPDDAITPKDRERLPADPEPRTTWETRLQCSNCKTQVRFENRRPEWEVDPERERLNREAEAFAEEWKGRVFPWVKEQDRRPSWRPGAPLDVPEETLQEWEAIRQRYQPISNRLIFYWPPGVWDGRGPHSVMGVGEMPDTRAIPCPCCDAWIRPTDGF